MARHAKHAARKPAHGHAQRLAALKRGGKPMPSSGMHKMPGGHMMPDDEMTAKMKPPVKKDKPK